MVPICLSMIVRDESPIIDRCLASVRPWISHWAIVDTGSTDGTQDRVRGTLAGLPGELVERPWTDFATARNQSLQLAREVTSGQGFALVIDADEVLESDRDFTWPDLTCDGYSIITRLDEIEYHRQQLVRLSLPWVWLGVVHEALECPGVPTVTQGEIHGLINRPRTDGHRSQNPRKYLDDAETLAKELKRNPGDTRAAFYFAQSLRDGGKLEEALAAYERRAQLQGFVEEDWFARYEIARLKDALDRPDAQDAFLAAHVTRPTRAEPLVSLARHLNARNRFVEAYAYADAALRIPKTDDRLFVDRSCYTWRPREEKALAAYYLWRRDEAVALWREILDSGDMPEPDRARILANLEHVPCPAR